MRFPIKDKEKISFYIVKPCLLKGIHLYVHRIYLTCLAQTMGETIQVNYSFCLFIYTSSYPYQRHLLKEQSQSIEQTNNKHNSYGPS